MGLPVLAQGRECGECDACCVHLDVDDEAIAHKRGVACPRLGGDHRCTQYEVRPQTCRDFRCLWLEGFGAVTDRPDVLGCIFHVAASEDGSGLLYIAANETRPGALDAGQPAHGAIKAMGWSTPVVATRVDGSRSAIAPLHLGAGDKQSVPR
jgi:hypothetical protein